MSKRVISIAGMALCAFAGQSVAQDQAALVDEGKALIKQYGDALRTELTTAVKEKGAPHAISVCNHIAPEIAQKVSAQSGWTVGRSSHRLRNPNNKPDAFTTAAMEEFLAKIAAGGKPEDLAKAAIVEEGGKKVFHLVKAIPTGEVCLGCHGGAEVKPEVEAALAGLYPDDAARGFSVGDMRGVFTLTKQLD